MPQDAVWSEIQFFQDVDHGLRSTDTVEADASFSVYRKLEFLLQDGYLSVHRQYAFKPPIQADFAHLQTRIPFQNGEQLLLSLDSPLIRQKACATEKGTVSVRCGGIGGADYGVGTAEVAVEIDEHI